MKTTLLPVLGLTALCALFTCNGKAQSVETMPPVVVKAIPEAGSKDVTPGEVEIKVTFSKVMTDQSWSWSSAWQNSTPEGTEKPKYESDGKTCVLKVKLEPNKTYGYWINSQNFHGFQDKEHHAAVPYLLVFRTGAAK